MDADVNALCVWHEDGEALLRGRTGQLGTAAARVRITHDMLNSWHGANRSALCAFGIAFDERSRLPESAAAVGPAIEIAPPLWATGIAELFALTWK